MKKFKIGQHIRLKSLPNSNIEITGINNAGYIYMGDAVVNGSIIGKEQKVIPFEYEDDYEVIACGEKKSMKNEEKAKETADFLYFKLSHIDYGTLKRELLEMAEWKEQQMIEKAVEMFHKDSRWDYIFGVYPELINDFKNYMEK